MGRFSRKPGLIVSATIKSGLIILVKQWLAANRSWPTILLWGGDASSCPAQRTMGFPCSDHAVQGESQMIFSERGNGENLVYSKPALSRHNLCKAIFH